MASQRKHRQRQACTAIKTDPFYGHHELASSQKTLSSSGKACCMPARSGTMLCYYSGRCARDRRVRWAKWAARIAKQALEMTCTSAGSAQHGRSQRHAARAPRVANQATKGQPHPGVIRSSANAAAHSASRITPGRSPESLGSVALKGQLCKHSTTV